MAREEHVTSILLQDVRGGMEESALMEKFGFTSVELRTAIQDLVSRGLLRKDEWKSTRQPKRKISAKDIVGDISSGMSKVELMEKYKLSPNMLQSICRKLLQSRSITPRQLADTDLEATITDMPIRDRHRLRLDLEIPVYESSRPEVVGRLCDISEEGVGLEGIETPVGDRRGFVVLGDVFGEVPSFEFEAQCRWLKRDQADGTLYGGFEITAISEWDKSQLWRLIDLVTLRG